LGANFVEQDAIDKSVVSDSVVDKANLIFREIFKNAFLIQEGKEISKQKFKECLVNRNMQKEMTAK
jgi:hypothetical protein